MRTVLAALAISLGLLGGGIAVGGRYVAVPTGTNAIARMDRFTGEVTMCVVGAAGDACGFVLDPAPSDETPPTEAP